MVQTIETVNNAVNGVVWGWPALILLGFVGILMTVLTKFFQVGHIGHWFKNTIGAIFKDKHVTGHTKDRTISQFQSLCTALAATVGTGNIVGVAGAIATGGPGAVFWMWLIAFFGMMTNYSENVLGILYRRKDKKGEWHGGAMYYLKEGLGAKKGCKHIGVILAVLFSFFCLLALVINHKLGLNMMFISAPMEGTILGPISWLLDQIYTPVLVLVQMTGPFLVVLHIKQKSGLLDRPSWYQPIAE